MLDRSVNRARTSADQGDAEKELDIAVEEVPAAVLRMLQERYGNTVVAEALAGGGGALGELVAAATADDAAGRRGGAGAAFVSNQAMQDAMPAPDAAVTAIGQEPEVGTPSPSPAKSAGTAPSSSTGAGVALQSTGAAPVAASISSQPDGLVDYYMQTHWDPAEFHGLGHTLGYPGNLSSDRVSTVSMLLPADTSPEVRAVVEVMSAAACGFFDDYLVGQAAEMLGLSGDFVRDLIDIGSTATKFVTLDDPTGLALFGTMTALDGLLGGFDLVLDHITGVMANLSTISWALWGATQLIGQLPVAAATVLASAAGFATVEAMVQAIAAVEAAIAAVTGAINSPLKLLQASTDVLRSALDVIQYMYAEYGADQAEASGNFERARAYRDLMRSHAFDAINDWLSGTVNALLMLPYASIVQKVGIVAINLVVSGPSMDVLSWKGPGVDDVVGAVETVVDAVADTEWWNEFLTIGVGLPPMVDLPGLADPMQTDQGRTPFVERREGTGLGSLSAARERTIASLAAGWASLNADDPRWFQALVTDIATPDDGATFDQALSPSHWIGELVRNMPQLAEFIADTSLEGIAMGCDAAAAVLPGTQPVFDAITLTIAELKPQLEEVLVQVETVLQKQSVDLASLDAIAARLEAGLADLRALVDPTEGVQAAADEIVATFEGLRVDPAEFQLPDWAPVSLVDDIVDPLNATVDGAIAQVRAFEARMVEGWRSAVDGLILAVEGKVQAFRAQIADGGSFHEALEAQLAAFQAQMALATVAFREWDGVVTVDVGAAVAFLTSTAEAARAAAATEGPDGKGDPWPGILRDVAVPAIEAWRSRHAAEVEGQYHPSIPPWELDACAALYTGVSDDPQLSPDRKVSVESAWQAVRAFDGQQGRQALYGFWRAEEALARAASDARSP